MTVEYYSPGHLRTVVPFLPHAPRWLLLGGPADADEAQTARRIWPDIRIVGFEPNYEARDWQLHVGRWPVNCPLYPVALADHDRGVTVTSQPGNLRGASVNPDATGVTELVPSMTLDQADADVGPVEDAILWLDVEGSELAAVRGAAGLFARRAVILVNVEVQARRAGQNAELAELLTGHGLRKVHKWNDSPACEDQVWVL